MTMSPEGDLVVWKNRGRPTGEEREIMNCPKKLKAELDKLKKEIGYKEGTEILLALSVATDEMVRHVNMFPEVFYLDVTANTNRQKRDLFIMVVKDANGQTFIGNATVIPSGKRWVFQKIYQSFFVHLYGRVTISRNRLALTDDDNAEWGAFDNCIKTMNCYQDSTHMLCVCVFHALVMGYHEQIHPHLPRKQKKKKSGNQDKTLDGKSDLSRDGEIYGTIIYQWLQSTCTDCESKEEYDRSNTELTRFLRKESTVDALGSECINAIVAFHENLKSKESKLAGYIRKEVMNCMDACTTSPVESNNNALKHGPSKISSNMNVDNATVRLLDGINTRLKRRHYQAKRELNRRNMASQAPTKDYIIGKGQALSDRNHDRHFHMKSAQIGPNTFVCWDFDDLDPNKIDSHLKFYLPDFVRVRTITAEKYEDGKCFFPCDCYARERVGCPCACFYKIVASAKVPLEKRTEVGMFDVRMLKLFNSHYGDTDKNGTNTEVGDLLYDAQSASFRNEGMGVEVTEDLFDLIVDADDGKYPKLGEGTSDNDLREALWVLDRQKKMCTTRIDLEMNRIEENPDLAEEVYGTEDIESLTKDYENEYHSGESVLISHLNKRMQESIEAASKKDVGTNASIDRPTDEESDEMRKEWVDSLDNLRKDSRVTTMMLGILDRGIKICVAECWSSVHSLFGEQGGGVNCLRMYGETQSEPGRALKRKKGIKG
ncbi:hypothetical protein ACHAXR_013004 [Thalassiosira sp. AJA248-18]